MPDRNADPRVTANEGPAIQMDPADHAKTSSNGQNGRAGAIYRAETADMISQGEYRKAMAREIRDVRRAAQEASGDRTKYNEAINEMLDYAKESGQLPLNKRKAK
jgi:filamentous hemagglutinin